MDEVDELNFPYSARTILQQIVSRYHREGVLFVDVGVLFGVSTRPLI